LNPYKFGFQLGFAVFKKHCNDVVQVAVEFVERFALGMGARKTGYKSNEQS